METTLQVPTRFRLQELLDAQKPPLSQTELARRSEVSFATVNRLCTNATSQVSLATLDAISKVLRNPDGSSVEPGDLIEREPEPKKKRL
jgi:DNA-binding Xre family transcriptional regulator